MLKYHSGVMNIQVRAGFVLHVGRIEGSLRVGDIVNAQGRMALRSVLKKLKPPPLPIKSLSAFT